MKIRIQIVVLALIFSFMAANAWAISYSWWRIPHLAYGGGYTSYLTIREINGVPSKQVWVYLYDDDGKFLAATVDGSAASTTAGYSFTFTLGTHQEKTFAITGSASDLKVGSVQIAAEGLGELSSSLRFTTKDGAGNATDVVGILPSEPNFNWTVSVEKRGSTDYTGIAIQNPWTSSMNVTVDFYQNGSRVPGTTTRTFTIPGSGHLAKFVHETVLFGDAWSNFSGIGTLRIASATNTFVPVALRGDGSQYSSLSADVGAQYWTMYFTTSSGNQNCTWTWKTVEGYTFIGKENNPDNVDNYVKLRGVMATDLSPQYFLAEWNWRNSSDSSEGVTIFQGVPSKEGSTDVVNGKRWMYKSDGTILNGPYTFKATRVY